MLNLLTSIQIREVDIFTLKNKPVSSIDLMENAAEAFCNKFFELFPKKNETISIHCGTGNNGGDGLAIARILNRHGYDVSVKIARFSFKETADFTNNLNRLKKTTVDIIEFSGTDNLPEENSKILIDALLGSGLNKPLAGDTEFLVQYLNRLNKKGIAVDVPTGFFAEGRIDEQATVFKATDVITFQRPKINFFFPESIHAFQNFHVVDIGLDEEFIQSQQSEWHLIEEKDISEMLKPRKKFTHKGIYGHALIIAGTNETMGAALLCADACLHTGAGLITACMPDAGLGALNTRSPEIMFIARNEEINLEKYQAVAIGPGLGIDSSAVQLVKQIIEFGKLPFVLDADALNILSNNPEWLTDLPKESILTPHVKEFDRLFGEHSGWWQRLETARNKAKEHQIIIILKNEYTFIIQSNGEVHINPTGNAAMATGGMGDVLTGMIASFLAQGYDPVMAATVACYIHGKTGDVLKKKGGMFTIPPRYLIKALPKIIESLLPDPD